MHRGRTVMLHHLPSGIVIVVASTCQGEVRNRPKAPSHTSRQIEHEAARKKVSAQHVDRMKIFPKLYLGMDHRDPRLLPIALSEPSTKWPTRTSQRGASIRVKISPRFNLGTGQRLLPIPLGELSMKWPARRSRRGMLTRMKMSPRLYYLGIDSPMHFQRD